MVQELTPVNDHSQWEARIWLLCLRVLLRALLYQLASGQESHLRSVFWSCVRRMTTLDPGSPACLGSLQTKLKLLLSLFTACQQSTSIGRDKHNVLLYYYCIQQQMSNTRGNALHVALSCIMLKVASVVIISTSFWHMNGNGYIQLKTADCALP